MTSSGSNVFKLLEWDSNFFGFPIALIQKDVLGENELSMALSQLKNQGVKCVYWPASAQHPELINFACKQNGKLVDTKILYSRSLAGFTFTYAEKLYISPYTSDEPDVQLKQLALASGIYSRFLKDERFGSKNFEKLYLQWITDSVKKKIALEVFVSRFQNDFTGMITVGGKDGIGKIGLVAISEKYRGVGIGNMLMEYTLMWFNKKRYNKVEVATQKENQAACSLYAKFGFSPEKTYNYFHFWL
ncbi:MAG: GNAT family N-acetyltransferase [Bacteroidia bacterium]|nr:GNAT family N-acetyltransferase [Bacteroidia bacterium]